MRFIIIFVASATFILAGCSNEESAPTPAPQDAVTNVVEEADPAAVADEADTEEELPQVVEESGGEPDAAETQDQPIVLAQADSGASAADNREWKYKEGQHYNRLVPTQPTVGGADKVEVAEFFWYGCGHCYEFETFINRWDEATKPAEARFVRIPATWNPLVKLHAQLYYTEEVLVKSGKIADAAGFRAAVFNEYHRRGNRLTSMTAIKELFTRFNVSAEDFDSTWSSFEVAQKLRVSEDLSRRYAITGVPAMVVNGKYRTGKAEAGTYPVLLEIVNELIEKESIR